jgi:Xaa-Pro aminopeptidase
MNEPFDAPLLDRLMDESGMQLVIATSKPNVQYLLGGYRFFFFEQMDAIGLSRYLPAVGYQANMPETAFFVGNPMERWQQEIEPLWVPTVKNESRSSIETAELLAGIVTKLSLGKATIGLEMPFVPADCHRRLSELLPGARFIDAVTVLEELRARKLPYELELIRRASEAIVGSMEACFQRIRSGTSTRVIADVLRQEETARGLTFDYCLVTAGPSLNRAPSGALLTRGMALSLDSGGTMGGYIGDVARMAVSGSPSPALEELLDEVDAVQMAARRVVTPGARGGAIYDAARAEIARLPHGREMDFEAHGVGLVSHEVPHLTGEGTWPYPGTHADRPLQSSMVVSIETTLKNREAGFIKLEDTVVVTPDGCEAYGDSARGWNIVGS